MISGLPWCMPFIVQRIAAMVPASPLPQAAS